MSTVDDDVITPPLPARQHPLPSATPAPGFLGRVGRSLLEVLQILGEGAFVFLGTLHRLRLSGPTWTRIMAQMVRIGTDTLPLAFLVSLFVGMVLVVQAADQLQQYTQEILGSIVGLAMTKELGPVIMGFLIAGRVGSSVAAEIGSMNVNDEINALKTMDIDPLLFLSVPRFIAMILALPMLVLYADVIGIVGGAIVVAFDPTVKISVYQYLDNLTGWVNFKDVVVGLVKGFTFAVIISVIACTFGFRTKGGSEGVAVSTTAAVVWSFVLIVIFDYIIVRLAILF
jgi:phospholipid/cholesterol/gamma-HCH transport system permease protein